MADWNALTPEQKFAMAAAALVRNELENHHSDEFITDAMMRVINTVVRDGVFTAAVLHNRAKEGDQHALRDYRQAQDNAPPYWEAPQMLRSY